MAEIELIAEALGFPEGPVVMDDGSIIVVEITGQRITRCWNGRKETVCAIGGGPNGAAIGPDGALYVCNNGGMDTRRFQSAHGPGHEGRVERVDLATGKVERLYDRCDGVPLSGPNDLMFDCDGQIWFTDLGKRYDRLGEASALYCARPDGTSITRIHDHAVGYNGVGLSPDMTTVYVADTFQARVYAFDRRVEAQRPRLVATVPGQVGLDSLAMTAAGNVCVATLFNGGISTVAPGGAVTHRAFDDPYTTNIAFGGDDMRDAYVTLSSSGRLIKTRWDEPGMRLVYNA